MLELRVLGSSACPRNTLAAAAFHQSAKCHRAHKELEIISAPSGILGAQPRGFRVPWRSTDCRVPGGNARVSLSTDVTLSPDVTTRDCGIQLSSVFLPVTVGVSPLPFKADTLPWKTNACNKALERGAGGGRCSLQPALPGSRPSLPFAHPVPQQPGRFSGQNRAAESPQRPGWLGHRTRRATPFPSWSAPATGRALPGNGKMLF